jgi:hypothetical protein
MGEKAGKKPCEIYPGDETNTIGIKNSMEVKHKTKEQSSEKNAGSLKYFLSRLHRTQ